MIGIETQARVELASHVSRAVGPIWDKKSVPLAVCVSQRERERERERGEREGEREREREGGREGGRERKGGSERAQRREHKHRITCHHIKKKPYRDYALNRCTPHTRHVCILYYQCTVHNVTCVYVYTYYVATVHNVM